MALLAGAARLGGMTVFDRSWYGRVLVERVEELATEGAVGARLRRRSSAFERTFCAEGGVLVKFWLHISRRSSCSASRSAEDPLKSWKMTDDDWRNREKRPLYDEAIEDMLERTDHAQRPGT